MPHEQVKFETKYITIFMIVSVKWVKSGFIVMYDNNLWMWSLSRIMPK